MRLLKTKILRAKEALKKKKLILRGQTSLSRANILQEPSEILQTKEEDTSNLIQYLSSPEVGSYQPKPRKKLSKSTRKRKIPETKNIPINYGKAIASFAISPLAVPYLERFLNEEKLTTKEFVEIIGGSKEGIRGIDSLRAMLLINEEKDSEKIMLCKKAFQWIGEIFIKYFSVNWIIHGRMTHKMTYLKYRHKMLRRIRLPEHFTYVRRGQEKKSVKKCSVKE